MPYSKKCDAILSDRTSTKLSSSRLQAAYVIHECSWHEDTMFASVKLTVGDSNGP